MKEKNSGPELKKKIEYKRQIELKTLEKRLGKACGVSGKEKTMQRPAWLDYAYEEKQYIQTCEIFNIKNQEKMFDNREMIK